MISTANIVEFCKSFVDHQQKGEEGDDFLVTHIVFTGSSKKHVDIHQHYVWGIVVFSKGIVNYHHSEDLEVLLPKYILDSDTINSVLFTTQNLGGENANALMPPSNFQKKRSELWCF